MLVAIALLAVAAPGMIRGGVAGFPRRPLLLGWLIFLPGSGPVSHSSTCREDFLGRRESAKSILPCRPPNDLLVLPRRVLSAGHRNAL